MHSVPQINDIEWNNLEQTLKMLCLAVAQIETALGEGNQEAKIIGNVFGEISTLSQQLRNSTETNSETCDRIDQQVMQAVTAFQFYDRMSQRVDHVQAGLRKLIDVMQYENEFQNPQVWQTIQKEIKASYTMEEEKLMFEKIMQGIPIEEALAISRHNFRGQSETEEDEDGDTVVFF